ncbi:MAG: ABC transporter permease subunit, partial [Sciscionella sp.]
MTAVTEKPAPVARPAEPDRRTRGGSGLVTLLAIVVAMVIGGILMIFSDDRVRASLGYFFAAPGNFFAYSWQVVSGAYEAMFAGAIFNVGNDGSLAGILGPISTTVYTAAPLICAGLGVALAFRAGLFNIGGEGQVIAGAFAAGYVGFAVHLPVALHVIVAIVAGVLAGAFWGFLAGFLKARAGAHEVISTIMLNW